MPPFSLSPLTKTLGVIIIGAGISFTCTSFASAQTSLQTQQVVQQSYNIPAGTLAQSLNRFASESGITLSFTPDLVEGKQAAAITGNYTPQQGLNKLLQDSELEAVIKADGSYTLRRSIKVGKLSTVKVQADAVLPTTEHSGSYTTESMSTATKLNLSIRETPQSVTVMTRDRMDDQAMIRASDALVNIPGITVSSWSGPGREVYYSRGFEIDNYTFEGMPVSKEEGQSILGDLAIYDRLEVVRGSAGLTQGTGTPSAAINFVLKRPTRDFQASIQGQVGSWNFLGVQADVSGSLNDGGSLRGRTVVQGRDSDSFQDIAEEKRQLFYVIGEADLTASTLLTLSLSRQKNDDIMTWSGIPTAPNGDPLDLPRSTFLGNESDFWDSTNTTAFASLEHSFDNDWKINFSSLWIWTEKDARVSGVGWDWDGSDPASQTFYQTGLAFKVDSDRTTYDLSARGPFHLLGREHELVLGANSRIKDKDGSTAGYWWLAPRLVTDMDIFNWNHDAVWPGSYEDHRDYFFTEEERQHGFYATTRLNLADPLKLILGMRYDWYEFTNNSQYIYEDAWVVSDPWEYDYDRHLTKYAGLVYDLNSQHSAYVSYTDIFQPQDVRDASNQFIEPILGKNYEVGIKGEYFDGALNASASVFRVDQANLAIELENQPVTCPFYPNSTCYRAAGLVRSKGYDLELQGALSSNWQIGAGYTYVTSEIIKDGNPESIGNRLNKNLPRSQFKLFTSYRFPGDQWRIGGNLRWQEKVDHTGEWVPNYYTRQSAYTIVDAMLGYQYDEHLDIQVNVSNLFDRSYYRVIATNGGNAMYGEPRKIMLTAKYTF